MSPIASTLATTGQVLTAAKTAESAVHTALNFEQFSDSALPYFILSSLLVKSGAVIPTAKKSKVVVSNADSHASSSGSLASTKRHGTLETHLPNERVWRVDQPQSYTHVSEDGKKTEKVTTIDFKTIDKDISSFVNVNKLIETIKAGNLPTAEQFCLALLDIVDAIDLGILGENISIHRLEPHVKERQITVKETVTSKTDSTQRAINKDVQQIGKHTEVQTQEVILSGQGIDTRTLAKEEYSTERTRYSEFKQDEQSILQKWFGSEVAGTHRVYDEIKTKHTIAASGPDGQLKTITNDTASNVEEIHKHTSKEWKQGYVTYIPLVGTAVDIGRKYQAGVAVTFGDLAKLAIDAGVVALMFVPGGQVAAVGKGTGAGVTKIVTAHARKNLAKAALNPKGAAAKLRSYYSNPRAVFSPENIAAKTKCVAHNPMKGDMLKTLAELSKLEKQGVNIRSFLRKEFADMGAEGKLIADTLTRNLRYLKQNGWLTPENITRMSQGLNPWGTLKNLLGKPFRLDVDHVIPKSLAPELKAHPGNLVFLPQIDNILKSNNILRHVVQHVKKFKEIMPHWKPSPELLEEISKFKAPQI